MNQPDRSYSAFPLWLELSGLPAHLNHKAKAPFPWIVFRKIVELDVLEHPVRPGIVEVSVATLAMSCGIDNAKVHKSLKAMRKTGLLRAFIPENDEEPACLQVITPIPTPKTPDEVRAQHPDLFLEAHWPPRYAVAIVEEDANKGELTRAEKIKKVVDLYLNVFSMRLNSLVVDELQLISDRYDLDLIEKVFQIARKREVRSLGWVVTEIRRELAVRKKAEEIRAAEKA